MSTKVITFCALLVGLTLVLLPGCKIEITVPESGRVVTKSGAYTCESGKTCVIDVVDVFFDETFEAEPATGYIFLNWRKKDRGLCGGRKEPCHLYTTTFPGSPLEQFLESGELFYLEPVFAAPNTWSRVGENIYGEESRDRSGSSVSLSADGSRLAIGAPGNTGELTDVYDVGQVRVYGWSGATWRQLGADIDGEADGDRFGTSVSLSADGQRLAIGAIWTNDNGESSGQVRVYKWSGTTWQQLGGDLNGEAAYDSSGTAVTLSADGNRLAIGAPRNGGGGHRSGQVRVYQWLNSAWQQLGEDIDGKAAGELAGSAVSLSADGHRLAIGAIENDDNGDSSGAARVYAWSGMGWQQQGSDINGKDPYDWLNSVSLSANGNRLAIGTAQADYVQVYTWSGNQWTQLGGDINADAEYEKFGYSVSLSADGSRLGIGAHWNDDNGYNAGQARVYRWSGEDWLQLGGNINGAAKFQTFGTSLSLAANGKRLAVGAPDSGGYVGVYEMTYAEVPPPAVDPMKVYLLSPAHTEQISQNNPATGCPYSSRAGYGLRVDFDWSDATSPVGIAGYHLRYMGRQASQPLIDTFITDSEFAFIRCDAYVNNLNASSGFVWTVQAEDNNGKLGPVNDEGSFVFKLCYLDNGNPCGTN
jgi:WD40 repeat protein